jgi:hypothetical protein
MSIKPIDIKTNIAGNDSASHLRENQKAHEQGQSGLLAQNQNKIQEKFETVHNVESSTARILRKQDEDAEKEKGKSDQDPKKPPEAPEPPPVEEPVPPLPDPKGFRGLKIDLKA